MAYRIELTETAEQSLRRITLEQINKAIRKLETSGTVALGVHEARKSFKKLRALLKLARPALKKNVYMRENIFFRDLSRKLSGTRDIQVMIESTLKLKTHDDFKKTHEVMQTLLTLLQDKKQRMETELKENTTQKVLKELKNCKQRFEVMDLSDFNRKLFLQGIIISYKRAKTDMEVAYRNSQIEPFHDWRKSLQHHMRHVQLITPLWPEYLSLRLHFARELAYILGEHNDLSVVLDFVIDNISHFGKSNQIHHFIDLCKQREIYLQNTAQPRGQRFFVITDKELQQQLHIFWKTATSISPLETVLLDNTQHHQLQYHKTNMLRPVQTAIEPTNTPKVEYL